MLTVFAFANTEAYIGNFDNQCRSQDSITIRRGGTNSWGEAFCGTLPLFKPVS